MRDTAPAPRQTMRGLCDEYAWLGPAGYTHPTGAQRWTRHPKTNPPAGRAAWTTLAMRTNDAQDASPACRRALFRVSPSVMAPCAGEFRPCGVGDGHDGPA